MRRTTITPPAKLVDELLPLVDARTKTEAVAVHELIRKNRIERGKSMIRKMYLSVDAEKIRHDDERLG
jgi:anti-sigma28 factor (negative regulator of flagellin synthesis)